MANTELQLLRSNRVSLLNIIKDLEEENRVLKKAINDLNESVNSMLWEMGTFDMGEE